MKERGEAARARKAPELAAAKASSHATRVPDDLLAVSRENKNNSKVLDAARVCVDFFGALVM